MAIGDILEIVGGSLGPGESENPHIPRGASAVGGLLSGFAAGRAGRRKLGAYDKVRRLEEKLGFPIDVLQRLSGQAQTEILKNAGFGVNEGLDVPLPQYENRSMRQLLRTGAPGATLEPPGGSGIFEGMPGGPMETPDRQQLPRQLPAIPPLSAVPENQRAGLLASRYDSALPADPSRDARARHSTLAGDVLDRKMGPGGIMGLDEQLRGAQIEGTKARTRYTNTRTQLALESSAGAPVPSWLLEQISLGGIRLPTGPVSYKALEKAMKFSGGFQEYERLLEEHLPSLIRKAGRDPDYDERDLKKDVTAVLGARLDAASRRATTGGKNILLDLFIARVWSAIQQSRLLSNTGDAPEPEEPYSIGAPYGMPDPSQGIIEDDAPPDDEGTYGVLGDEDEEE
jgi:hypothetical protein